MKPASHSHTHAPFRRAMRPTTLLATALALCGAASVQAVPVIPGAAGYGMDTKAGRGGAVYKVTNLNADGSGSLKACVDKTGPRTCVFEVSGAIRLTSDLKIRNSQLRIAGQTAPSPGIMIRGAGIVIVASDMLIQHIRVRPGDDTNGPDPDNRDSLRISGTDNGAGAQRGHRSLLVQLVHRRNREHLGSPRQHLFHQQHILRTSPRVAASGLRRLGLHAPWLRRAVRPSRQQQHHLRWAISWRTSSSAIRCRAPPSSSWSTIWSMTAGPWTSTCRARIATSPRIPSSATCSCAAPATAGRPSRSSCTPPALIRCHPAVACMSTTTARRTRGGSYSALVTLTGGDVIPNLMTQTTAPVWNSGLVVRKTADSAVYSWVLS